MVYFVFAGLLLVGAIVVLIIERVEYTSVEATVLESREQVVVNEREFSKLIVQHAVSYKCEKNKSDSEEKIRIVSFIPIRETDGAKVKIRVRKKTMEPVGDYFNKFVSIIHAMLLAAVVCLFMGFLSINIVAFPANDFENQVHILKLLPLAFSSLIVVMLLYDVLMLLNPRVVRVRGKYEGLMHTSDVHRLTNFYSLWYGSFRQFARYKGYMPRKKDLDTTLFFDSRKGTVTKGSDILFNVCLSVLVIALSVLYYLFFI